MNLNSNPERTPRRTSTHQMTAFEAAVDYAERQDIFLYFTAFMGIVMPAVVYFLYMKIHNYYQKKWKREAEIKELEKLKKKKGKNMKNSNLKKVINNDIEKIEISKMITLNIKIFFSLENEEIEKIINNQLKLLSSYNVTIHNISTMNVDEFLSFNGLCLFIIESNKDGTITDDILWFFEILQDYEERKEKLKNINYAIFGISDIKYGGKIYQKSGKFLSSLLYKLSANSISPIWFGDLNKENGISEQLKEWLMKINLVCQKQILLRKKYDNIVKEPLDILDEEENDIEYDSDESLEDETDEEDKEEEDDEENSEKDYSDIDSSESDDYENESKKKK
ncbi:Flavodoxin/nitric oxide synthase domain-containing protein [Strongyloides ratti]|uniref:Flavodoxin/nitric oxide synthase domain-containing protein n=1 Tax=Strongyloides ratti TaxID=34506 RepID=A0A090MZ30_STRRB|nr:Flavodoxin/nitric oxide synthase domain-containing protein [Strongyloides ratti]CEF68219.1 Flavodoxin/nitric oxide synthase domain-containing protein [Strongyloides ratti]